MRTSLIVGAAGVLVAILGACAAMIPIRGDAKSVPEAGAHAPRKLSGAPAPSRSLNLLFIHHSVGSQLLAEPGSGTGTEQHVNGGGLRKLLQGAGYKVHSMTYGSPLGEKTDMFDWPVKFSGHMSEILTTADGKQALPNGESHDVVMFKTCFPNNEFEGTGEPPGNPKGPELTIENAKAALTSLLPEFQKHPKTLFVYLTTPPIAPKTWSEPAWKWVLKAALGRTPTQKVSQQGHLARAFNDWSVSPDGWLKGYPLTNVVVVDYYDMLTNYGASNLLFYPSGDGGDSHPASEGQKKAAPLILDAINEAVARAGIGALAQNTDSMPPREASAAQ